MEKYSKIRKISNFGKLNEEEETQEVAQQTDVSPADSTYQIQAQEAKIDGKDITEATKQFNMFIDKYLVPMRENTTVKASPVVRGKIYELENTMRTILQAMQARDEKSREFIFSNMRKVSGEQKLD